MTLRPVIPALAAVLLAVAVLPAPAYQIQMGEGTNTLVAAADESLPEESLLLGHRLEVQARAEHDLWLAAATDVQSGGRTDGDLRVLARSAVLRGDMRRNVLAYAGGLQLATNAVVGGQVALFGSTVIAEGAVAGDAWIFARSATLGGTWGGDIHIQADEIRVAPGTVIAGDVIYSAPKEPVLDPSVELGGELRRRDTFLPGTDPLAGPGAFRSRLVVHGYLFLAAMLIGMPFVGLFPVLAGGAVRNLRASPWRVLIAGFLAVLLGPFLMGFAVMSIVGIPLAIVLGAVYLLLALLSQVVVALWLGHMILRRPGPQSFGQVLSALATGLFALYFAAALPGVASFIVLPVLVLGAGALVTARLPVRRLPPPPPTPLIMPESPDNPGT